MCIPKYFFQRTIISKNFKLPYIEFKFKSLHYSVHQIKLSLNRHGLI